MVNDAKSFSYKHFQNGLRSKFVGTQDSKSTVAVGYFLTFALAVAHPTAAQAECLVDFDDPKSISADHSGGVGRVATSGEWTLELRGSGVRITHPDQPEKFVSVWQYDSPPSDTIVPMSVRSFAVLDSDRSFVIELPKDSANPDGAQIVELKRLYSSSCNFIDRVVLWKCQTSGAQFSPSLGGAVASGWRSRWAVETLVYRGVGPPERIVGPNGIGLYYLRDDGYGRPHFVDRHRNLFVLEGEGIVPCSIARNGPKNSNAPTP